MKYFFVASFLLLLIACTPPDMFFPDQYNPGLSIFTNRGYNVGSVYINDSPWVSDLSTKINSLPIYISLDTTNNPTTDTLNIGWTGSFPTPNNFGNWNSYPNLNFAFPVKKNFTQADFLNWNGKLFPADTTTVTISLSYVPYFYANDSTSVVGSGKIYFVKITSDTSASGQANGISVSGLFEGNIGDSIILQKGRFDFVFATGNIYFP
jgi:hypothetical protein